MEQTGKLACKWTGSCKSTTLIKHGFSIVAYITTSTKYNKRESLERSIIKLPSSLVLYLMQVISLTSSTVTKIRIVL